MFFSKDFALRSIKVIDLIYITILYFFIGFMLAFFLDLCSEKIYGYEYDSKSTIRLIGEVVTQVASVTVMAYILRNLVQLIPFPLEGVYGFEHLRVREVSSGALITTFGTIFFYDLQNKLYYIRERSFPKRQKRISSLVHSSLW